MSAILNNCCLVKFTPSTSVESSVTAGAKAESDAFPLTSAAKAAHAAHDQAVIANAALRAVDLIFMRIFKAPAIRTEP